jgi:NAD(P)-dependent dehydrogenase (short-subunit alcohol dehydrogenase family)
VKFLVTGATGTVGGEVLKQLVSEGADVRAVTGEASKADLPDGVELVEADFTVAEDVDRALSGIDRVFLNMADDNGAVFFAGATKSRLDYVVLLSSFTAFVPLPSGDQNIVAYGTALARTGSQTPDCRSQRCARRALTTTS